MNILLLTDLLIALGIWGVGYAWMGRFVRPRWKIPGKLLFVMALTGLFSWLWGHWSVLIVLIHQGIGIFFHFQVCRKHSINPWTCQPRTEYLALQEKWAKGDFS